MILQALYELAQVEGLSEDLDFQDLPVAWHIALKPDGTLLGIHPRWELITPDGKKKAVRTVPVERIPMRFGRTSGVASQFLVDNAQYVLGAAPPDKPGKPARLAQCREAFRASVEACAEATGDPAIQSVLLFLTDLAEGRQSVSWGDDWEANDLFSFVVYPDLDVPVHLMPAAVDYWRKQRAEGPNESENAPRCVVTGQPVPEPVLFPLIKRVPEGTPSGVGLVTFNFPAVESQGWKGNENAPVSRDAAESCATAMNRLLHPAFPDPKEPGNTLPERRYRLTSDTVVLFWAPRTANRELVDLFQKLINVEEDLETLAEADTDEPDSERKARQVSGAVLENFRRIWKGIPPDLDDETPFYMLTVTGQQGRAIVRDWQKTTVKQAFNNVAQFFGEHSIVRNAPPAKGKEHPPAFPIPILEKALAVRGDTTRLPKALASEIFLCAVMGYRFPKHVLLRALDRARSESGRDEWMDKQYKDARAALIKAYLIRNEKMEIKPEMDTDEKNSGYLLGRLLALLEKIQEEALGDVNATLVDRYFKRASTNPGQVFPRLLRVSMSHQRKIRRAEKWRGQFKARKELLDEILTAFRIDLKDTGDFRIPPINWSKITEQLPGNLQPEEQGLFLLGYHQQRHALSVWQKRPKEETADSED